MARCAAEHEGCDELEEPDNDTMIVVSGFSRTAAVVVG